MALGGHLRIPRIRAQCIKRGVAHSLMVEEGTCLEVIYGGGGGCIMEAAGGLAGLWVPLRGSLQVHGTGQPWLISAGEALVTEHDVGFKAVGRANGSWLALLGGKRTWASLLGNTSVTDSQLWPEMHKADNELKRAAIAVARAVRPLELEGAVRAMVDKVAALQAPLHASIDRCPGRTWTKRRQVFLRLQRVRNYMSACCDKELDIKLLARRANYSPCHFVRIFHLVYQKTPHTYLVEQRLRHARKLLHSSNLAITEVALASGFENRSAFSRLFRQHFGTTAQEVRRRSPAPISLKF